MKFPALLPTTVVGSYPQPTWLVDHEALRDSRVPRVRTPQIWRETQGRGQVLQSDIWLPQMIARDERG